MNGSFAFAALTLAASAALLSSACSNDDSAPGDTPDAGGGGVAPVSQTPPTGATEVESWLQTGAYKEWSCESEVHASRAPSPHGFNRICSNDVISAMASATAGWPVGAAAVKELYASLTDTTPVGYAVYRKDQADSAGGASWYWYERVPVDTTGVPHDDSGVVADGFGTADGGPPTTICVGCHTGAGSDAMHTPTPGGRDFVYTPVP